MFDPNAPALIGATTHLIAWPLEKALVDKEEITLENNHPGSIACYNSTFNQVVSTKMDGVSDICSWNVRDRSDWDSHVLG